ncbi:hypothetical protein [Actinoplanes sp. NPDC049316]|uniref:hypothetical protein n=1 Tax=Actinoplanes sp. NPDC049316 TaxID=3154727 RepID=UPI00342847C3
MSIRLLSRCAATASAAVVTVTAGLAVAGPAFADVSITSATLSATTVVIDGDAGCGDRSTITLKLSDPGRDASPTADVSDPSGDLADFVVLGLSSSSGGALTYTGRINLCGFQKPGKYSVVINADWYDDDIVLHTLERTLSLNVQRPTTLTYNASPEPVKRGKSLTHSGQLKRDAYQFGPMYGPKGATVKFYFRAYSWKNYLYKGSVQTGADGKYSKKITAWDSGWWKAVYQGESWRQTATKWDEVKVSR